MDVWLRSVLWDSELPGFPSAAPFETHRLKGRLVLKGGAVKMIQGVREIFEILDQERNGEDQVPQEGKIVVIGRHLAPEKFERSFRNAID